jgi:hypothetical protein
MFGLTDNTPKNQVGKKVSIKRISEGQLRAIAHAVSQMIAITVAENPEALIILLSKFNVPLSESPSSEEMINRVMDKIAQQDLVFNHALEKLIESVMPELAPDKQYDNFGGIKDLFGSSNTLGGFGGSGSTGSGSKLFEGASSIGSSTASGAAGGGIVGAALGAVGGIFSFASTSKQQKIEKEKASAMTLSSLLQYKTAKMSSGGGNGMAAQIGLALLALAAIVFTIYLISKNRKNKLTETP